MLTSENLAKSLFDYFAERGFSEKQIFLRENISEIRIYGSLFVSFRLNQQKELSVLLESSFLDKDYLNFVSNGEIDKFYNSISNEARVERANYREFLKEISVDRSDGKYKYCAQVNSNDARQVFYAVFNECIRPAMYYLRTRSDKI